MFPQEPPKCMTQEEVQTSFSRIKRKRRLALFGLSYRYGLGIREASQLNLNDLDLKRNEIVIWRIKDIYSKMSDTRRRKIFEKSEDSREVVKL